MSVELTRYYVPEVWENFGNGGIAWLVLATEFCKTSELQWRDLCRQTLRTFKWDGSFVSNTCNVRRLEQLERFEYKQANYHLTEHDPTKPGGMP